MKLPGAGVLVSFEGVPEGEIDNRTLVTSCSGMCGGERLEELGGNRLEVVEFAGYGDGFVVG